MSPMLVNVFCAVIVILLTVGLDLMLFKGKILGLLSKVFNSKVDVDNVVLKGLADLRMRGEKEVVRIDERTLEGRVKVFLGALLLVPAFMLIFVIFLRK